MKKILYTAAIAALLAVLPVASQATPWTVDRGDGVHVPNPACNGDCGPSTPSKPDTPDTPSTPTEPSAPSTPSKPDTPATPTEPSTPSKPDTPTAPANTARSERSPQSYVAPVEQHWTGTCCLSEFDGKIYVHTAFGHNPNIAAKQCRARLKAQPKTCVGF